MLRKFIIAIVLAAFVGTSVQMLAYAQIDPMPFMSTPGTMVALSPHFSPAYLKGIVIHPEDPLKFDFIIYKGDKPLTDTQKRAEYTKLTKYFLASLAIPDDDQWVNLSPYEKDRIIKDDFGKTEMGRDLLAQDYLLKQITASLIYPESRLGQEFWKKVYAQAQKQFGTTDIPVNTFNKVWILPDDALIYEKGNTAYILKNHLQVMLEEDYLSLQKHYGIEKVSANKIHSIASKIVREIVLPELQKEINEGENFAPLRQVYSGMLLATWFKRALKQSLLGQIYANKGKVRGVDQDPRTNEEIYQQYLKAYKKGVFNFIKEDTDKLSNEMMPRKYFSGGLISEGMAFPNLPVTHDKVIGNRAMRSDVSFDDMAQIALVNNAAMISDKKNDITATVSLRRTLHTADDLVMLEKFVTGSEQEKLEARKYIQSRYEGYIKNAGLRYYYSAKFLSENLLGTKFSLDINEVQQLAYAAGWQVLIDYGSGKARATNPNFSINQAIVREIAALLREDWNLRRSDTQFIARLLQGINQAVEYPEGLLKDKYILTPEDIIDSFLKEYPTNLVVLMYIKRHVKKDQLFYKSALSVLNPTDFNIPSDYLEKELKNRIRQALLSLSEREENVLRRRLAIGKSDGEEMTLEEVANIWGWSRDEVRQIEARALRKIHHPSRNKILGFNFGLHWEEEYYDYGEPSADSFSRSIFKNGQTPGQLITALERDGYTIPDKEGDIAKLNALGRNPIFTNELREKALQGELSPELIKVLEGGWNRLLRFQVQSGGFYMDTVRTVLEMEYPEETPKRINTRMVHHRNSTPSSNDYYQDQITPEETLASTTLPMAATIRDLQDLPTLDGEMLVLLNGLGGESPFSYDQVAQLYGLTKQEIMDKEDVIIARLSRRNPAAGYQMQLYRDYRRKYPERAVQDNQNLRDRFHQEFFPPKEKSSKRPLSITQKNKLMDLMNLRGALTPLQWRILSYVLKGYSLDDIMKANNNLVDIPIARMRVLRKLRFILSLGVMEEFGTTQQIIDDLVRLSSESPVQRLMRHTGIDALAAVSQGDIQGVVELVMGLWPGLYDEQYLYTALEQGTQEGVFPYIPQASFQQTLHIIHRIARQVNIQADLRKQTILKTLIRDRFYGYIKDDPVKGLELLQKAIEDAGTDRVWSNLLKDVYDYYRQATAFQPRGFKENTINGQQPLLPAQRFGIWEEVQSLSNSEYESAVNMSEARIGKTMMAILGAYNVPNPGGRGYAVHRVLYTTSNQAKYEVANELKTRTDQDLDLQIVVLDSEQGDRRAQIEQAIKLAKDKTKNVVLIANYESVRDFPEAIAAFAPQAHIIDEVENLKGGEDTKRAPIIFGIPVQYRIGISARPIINKAEDVVELLLWARHHTFVSEGQDIQQARIRLQHMSPEQLFDALDPIKVRWRRKVVIPEVKEPIQDTEYVTYSSEEEKQVLDIRRNFIHWRLTQAKPGKNQANDHIFARYQLEREASVDLRLVLPQNRVSSSYLSSKIQRLDQIIDSELEHNGKVVVLVDFVEAVDLLIKHYDQLYGPGTAVGITGQVHLKDRQDAILRFRTNGQGPKILIGTTGLIGSSLNLFQVPGSPFHISRLVRLSRPWINVDDAERLVGIGQTEQVIATTLVSRFGEDIRSNGQGIRTIEEGVERLLARKRAIFTQVVDGQPVLDEGAEERLNSLSFQLTGEPVAAPTRDQAMKGGIDLNSANLTLHIKRDGNGVPLPLSHQDLAQLSNLQGLDPVILSIKPASQAVLFADLVAR